MLIPQSLHRLKDRIAQSVAFALPRSIAYWAYIRVQSHASTIYSHTEMGRANMIQTVRAWEQGLDPMDRHDQEILLTMRRRRDPCLPPLPQREW